MVNQASANQTPPRVAVIAFHGVADQRPGRTAQTISDLLLRLTDGRRKPRYSTFRELKIRLPVHAVRVQRSERAQSKTKTSKFKAVFEKYIQFDPRSNFLAELHRKDKGKSVAAERIKSSHKSAASIVEAERRTSSDTLAHQYMREQLETYEPEKADRLYGTSDSVYDTIQLVGTRFAEATPEEKESVVGPADKGTSSCQGQGCEIHIYEMFWADLSRVSSHLWRVLIDFFQLLAYLCGMGGKSLEFARAALPYSKWWTWFALARFGAEFALTQAVLVVNLFLLGLATFVLPFKVPPKWHDPVGVATLIVALFLGMAVWLYWKRHRFPAERWRLLLLPLALAALGLAGLAEWLTCPSCSSSQTHRSLFLAILYLWWWSVVTGLILWAMHAYSRRVRGVFATSVVCAVLGWITFCIELLYHQRRESGVTLDPVLTAAAETAELFLIVLVAVWFFFFVCTLITSLAGFGVARFACAECPPPDQKAARSAIWTVNLTLVVSAAVTLVANLAVWKALSLALEKFGDQPLSLSASSPFHSIHLEDFKTAVGFVNSLIEIVASGWFTIFFAGLGIAALIATWSLLPAVITKNPPDYDSSTTWLGKALSAGYRSLRGSGEILRALVVMGWLLILSKVYCRFHYPCFSENARHILDRPEILSSLGLVLLLMLTMSQGALRFLALGFRSVIDIALDVANWLRLHPRDQNPRARISARCVSQLEYLVDWRDPRDGGQYNAFVLIAHSQGTVISSEILRFLQLEKYPLIKALGDRKLYLLTMGCPLRQLYSLRFPHQYAWARHNNSVWPGTEPNPTDLGVAQWVNVYRSGDYVGRYLWHPDTGENPWQKDAYQESETALSSRRELCMGSGEHTHYWDATAPKIAKELDRLIATASGITVSSRAP
jgi:hypothetical protein